MGLFAKRGLRAVRRASFIAPCFQSEEVISIRNLICMRASGFGLTIPLQRCFKTPNQHYSAVFGLCLKLSKSVYLHNRPLRHEDNQAFPRLLGRTAGRPQRHHRENPDGLDIEYSSVKLIHSKPKEGEYFGSNWLAFYVVN